MQERIFRFSVAGLTFLLSIAFGFWYLGGNVKMLVGANKEAIITSILGIILSPALGFLVSTVNIFLWENVWPRRKVFCESSKELDEKYLKMMLKKFPNYPGITFTEGKYIINDNKGLLLNHQTILRNEGKKEVIDFSTRRMDVYYAHIHGFYSVLIGIISGIILNFYLNPQLIRCLNLPKVLFIAPPLIYLGIAYYQGIKAQKESNEFEKKFLLLMDEEKLDKS